MENPAINDRFINDDIYNLQKRFASANAGHHELTEILEFLDDYGYISRYDVDSYSKTMKSLFITHPRSIERARAFPDVIVIDTTNKTNVNRMPLTHIVGIDNLCSKKGARSLQSFSIATAVVVDEKATSYTWIMERLVELVWPRQQNVIHGLIVTDDDHGLAAAIAKVFPDAPHTLCAWHIRKKFVAKISKAFSKTSDEFIMLCDYSNKLI